MLGRQLTTSDKAVENLKLDEEPTGLKNGVNLTFINSQVPISNTFALYLNGLKLKKDIHYTLSGDTITMGDAPSSTDELISRYNY